MKNKKHDQYVQLLVSTALNTKHIVRTIVPTMTFFVGERPKPSWEIEFVAWICLDVFYVHPAAPTVSRISGNSLNEFDFSKCFEHPEPLRTYDLSRFHSLFAFHGIQHPLFRTGHVEVKIINYRKMFRITYNIF